MERTQYCPFDLVFEPAELDLVNHSVATSFGQLSTVRTPTVTSDQVTLFLHGVGGNWATWTPMLQADRQGSQGLGDVMLVDLPGFGDSENHLGHLNAVDVGRMLLDLCLDSGWKQVHLVGQSMGGFLALHMASLRHPEVVSVTSISGSFLSVLDTALHPIASLGRDPVSALSYLALSGLALAGPLGTGLLRVASETGVLPYLLNSAVAHPGDLRPGVVKELARGLRPRPFLQAAKNAHGFSPADAWSGIDVPNYAVFGAKDHLVPAGDMRRFAQMAPLAVCVVAKDSGHLAHVEEPYLVLHQCLLARGAA